MRFWLIGLVLLTTVCLSGTVFAREKELFDKNIKPADACPEKYVSQLRDKRVGLIINQTSVIGNVSLLDMLIGQGIRVTKIFVPEHGFRGQEDAGAHIDNSVDSATGIPVVSLYGNHKKPTEADLADVDVMVYDLQDVGVRFYTYISTMEYCMEACGAAHKQFMVLDRPNPLGFYVDGPVLQKEHKSFIGMQQVPVVYGMTAGEYAKMIKGEGWFNTAASLDLSVIKCDNYSHAKKYKLPVAPSPNLRSMAAVYAYPSLCFFEGTVLSVGRGTDLPFLQYGCPEFKEKFTYSFTPHSGKGAKSPLFENKECFGELVGTTEAEVLRKTGTKLQLGWLIKAYKAYPNRDKFFSSFFIKLAGYPELEAQIKKGVPEDKIRAGWKNDLDAFKMIRKKYLLYADF